MKEDLDTIINSMVTLVEYGVSPEDDGNKDWKLIRLRSMCSEINRDMDKLRKKCNKELDKS